MWFPWPWLDRKETEKADASTALAAIPARVPRWAAAVIAVLLVAVLASVLDSCRARRERKAALEEKEIALQAITDAARAGDERYAAELLRRDNQIAVLEAREASARGKLEASRRAAATPWTRPRNADALVGRFDALGYSAVCR